MPLPTPVPARSFLHDEDGALTIFGLFLLILMMVAGGFALDLMRSEADRARIQYTVDRAVLAAASLDQERDPETVVRDYITAAGLDDTPLRIDTVVTPNSRQVTVAADSVVDSLFMGMLGHEEVIEPIAASAREAGGDMEVSLVLDISGSMSGSKHSSLQAAAIQFADDLLANAAADNALAVISVVPYRESVNLGSRAASWFDMTMTHTMSNCVIFDTEADYQTTGIAAGTVLERVAHFDRLERNNNHDGSVRRPVCPTDDTNSILPWSTDLTEITTHINALQAANGTGTNLGAKVGVALLDPTLREHATQMIADGDLSSDFAGMPFEYDEPNVTKVLVVMTDGKNEEMRDIFPDRKNGPSGVFVYRPDLEVPVKTVVALSDNNGDGEINADDTPCSGTIGHADGVTCFDDGSGTLSAPLHGIDNIDGTRSNWSSYWYAGRAQGQDWDANGGTYTGYPWWTDADRRNWYDFEGEGTDPDTGNTVYTQYSVWSEEQQMFWVKNVNSNTNVARGGVWSSQPAGGTNAIELTFAEFHGAVPVTFSKFFDGHGGDPGIDSTTRTYYSNYEGIDLSSQDRLDGYLQQMCQTAREAGILVFTIAFQAPSGGQDDMRACAGLDNPTRFQNIETLDIGSAFDEIAHTLNRLKLTQ